MSWIVFEGGAAIVVVYGGIVVFESCLGYLVETEELSDET